MDIVKKKAVAYIRVSSDRQKDNTSKETQRDRIIQKAEAEGLEIVQWYTDDGISAKNAERKALKEMLSYVATSQSKIDYVLVYSLSRLSRDMGTFMQSIELVLQKRGVGVRSVLEHTDDTPTGRFMKNLFVSVSQLDNEIKMEYTRDNIDRKSVV